MHMGATEQYFFCTLTFTWKGDAYLFRGQYLVVLCVPKLFIAWNISFHENSKYKDSFFHYFVSGCLRSRALSQFLQVSADRKLENKLETYKNLEIKLEIYKNLENKLEI